MNTVLSTLPIKSYPQTFHLAIRAGQQQPVTKSCADETRMQKHGSLWSGLRLLAFLSAVQMFNVCPVGAASSSAGQNWPQWRGPVSTGVAPAGQPPTTWSETSNVRWKVKIAGTGSATPIVWDNQVFIQTAIPTGKKVESPAATTNSPTAAGAAASSAPGGNPPERRGGGRGSGGEPKPTEFHQFVVLALDRATGKVLWQKIAREEVPHEAHRPNDGTFASSSPITDGQNLFAYFGSRGLHSYDLQGKLKWQKDLGRMQTKMSFGEGSSPALFGNTIVVNWDHEGEDFIVALNKDDGKELWRQPRNEDTSWSTPLIVEHEGQRQVIVSATKKIRTYDLSSGKQLWKCGGMTANAIPTPVPGEGVVYVTSGFRGNALLAIRLGRTGDLTDTDAIVWSHNKNTPLLPLSTASSVLSPRVIERKVKPSFSILPSVGPGRIRPPPPPPPPPALAMVVFQL